MKNKVLYLVSSAAFIRSFAQVMHTPSQIEMRASLGTNATMIGMVLSVYALVFAFSQVAYGPVVDRFEGKRILLVGMIMFTVGSLGCYLAPGIGLLLAARSVQALGIAAAAVVAIALIADLIPYEQRGRALGTFEIFNAAGAAAGPVAGAYVAVWIGWRVDFFVLAILGLGFLLFSLKELPAQPVQPQSVGLAEVGTILRNPATLGALFMGMAQFYGLFTNFAILPLLLTERMGMEVGRTGVMIAFLPLGAMIGSLIGGRFVDRFSLRLTLLLGSAGTVISFSALTPFSGLASPDTPLIVVPVIIMACGFSVGFGLPALLKIMVDFFPEMRGTAGAMQVFARFFGATLAPALTSYLADSVGLAAGFGSAAAILAVGGLLGFFTISDPEPFDAKLKADKSGWLEQT